LRCKASNPPFDSYIAKKIKLQACQKKEKCTRVHVLIAASKPRSPLSQKKEGQFIVVNAYQSIENQDFKEDFKRLLKLRFLLNSD
jgi:hypothetical protein